MTPAPTDLPAPDLGERLAAALLRRAHGGDAAVLTATIRRLCTDRSLGHVCLALPDRAGSACEPEDSSTGALAAWPTLTAWRAELAASGLCGDGRDAAALHPLVLDRAGRLYLRRDFVAERTLRDWLRQRMTTPTLVAPDAFASALAALEPTRTAPQGTIDWQLAAVAAAARSPFTLLTGGPGTGKTTTVARLLGVLLRLQPELRIALAAPTGKAAARLAEALQQRAAAWPELAKVAARLQPTTLHRLLGYRPGDDSFRASAQQPLPFELVVVDEASMVDPTLLAVLCSAMQPNARLLLVGDRDQLAAIAAGQVLGELCRAAKPERGVGSQLAGFVHAATGMVLPTQSPASPLADHTIALRENHRFGQQPGIGGFARALADRDTAAALTSLRAGHADLLHAADAERALAEIAPLLFAATTARTAEQALAALATVRILTATRHGPLGALAWNRRVEALLQQRGVRVDSPWYPGRPVLVTQNDSQSRLWNGDLGVVVKTPEGRPMVAFQGSDGSVRQVQPLRLPAHETAWAMTVHKAQGSEYDTILLSMPDRAGPGWQAPLLYTGISRARRRAVLLADPGLLGPALAHWPQRTSGLADFAAD